MTPDAIIESTRANVAAILKERFPQTVDFSDGSYALSYGSSSVGVVVRRYTETDTMVEIMAQVVSGAEITPELLKWLLRKNAELHFGSFGLLFDDTIIFTYTLPGSVVTSAALEAAIGSVAVIADHYDDEVIKMAGGKRVVDVSV